MTMQKHALMQRIIEQLLPEEQCLFSEYQIEALHRSALSLPKRNHAINVRLSIPFPGKGIYLVLFAGKELRSKKRLLADRDFQILPRVILLLISLLGCATIFGLAYSQRILAINNQRNASSLNESSDVIHPTVVPFKYDQEQCETSFREWRDGECIDYEHDHTF
ncbi:hypothetical protein DXZ20_01760 [Leptolyngbyaceae cyanobacterium CCMR0081]|uniref:Uncharacterized protein n=2 Tax=Adonisia TaxID=2950183 RepID=A0A6M0RFA2_9CYAN|nr:hypothetical protein [Adonisia turfae CCMR0081]